MVTYDDAVSRRVDEPASDSPLVVRRYVAVVQRYDGHCQRTRRIGRLVFHRIPGLEIPRRRGADRGIPAAAAFCAGAVHHGFPDPRAGAFERPIVTHQQCHIAFGRSTGVRSGKIPDTEG